MPVDYGPLVNQSDRPHYRSHIIKHINCGDNCSRDHVYIRRIAVPKVAGHEKDLDNIPNPQEPIQGSLIIRDLEINLK